MATSLPHEILYEGAALHRDIRTWKAEWARELEGCDGVPTGEDGTPSADASRRFPSPLHAYYPFLFHTLFSEVPVEIVRELALADRLYTEHLLSYDRFLDRPNRIDTAGLFLAQLQHMQSLKRVLTRFPAGHPFWDYFHGCYFETWKAAREEKLWHAHRITNLSLQRFCKVARGKTALLKPFSVALAFLANKAQEGACLSASLDRHHIALVLIDDLEDWRQDFLSRNFTYLLSCLIRSEGLSDEISSGAPVSPDRIGRLLYASGLMERQIGRAEHFFRASNTVLGPLPLPLWKDFNRGFEERCRALRFDLAEIRRREQGRMRRRSSLNRTAPSTGSRSPSSTREFQIRAGIRFLVIHHGQDNTFRLLRSPHAYLQPSKPVAPSRSVATLLVRSLLPLQALDPGLQSLFGSARERLARPAASCLPSTLPAGLEGAFEGLPAERGALSRLDARFSPGYGPLPDGLFWANVLYACCELGWKPPRLSAYVENCVVRADYRTWSHGVSFGPIAPEWTRYTSRPVLPLLVFCRSLGESLPRKTLQDWLLEPYRTNGSWGDTTATALTLLCLQLTAYHGPETESAIRKLAESQESDGSWPPNAIYREGTAYFGSRALTTAWCLEALFRYHQAVSRNSGSGGSTP